MSILFTGKTRKLCFWAQHRSGPQPLPGQMSKSMIWLLRLFLKAVLSCHLGLYVRCVCWLTLNDCLCRETVPSPKFLVQAKSWSQKPGRRGPVLPVGPDTLSAWRFYTCQAQLPGQAATGSCSHWEGGQQPLLSAAPVSKHPLPPHFPPPAHRHPRGLLRVVVVICWPPVKCPRVKISRQRHLPQDT